ncbi:hypothetical protein SLEP1_g45186 [Rubroshorea leprosula]|uniref:Uncharacterized protein n=1 Tax=Rubroshorea leprosula TaxID=152421 RepID=A0AAV5LIZ8_9ROSI|nr:hypothetical protein SLEP1_g45186 [Rubroshorea leprosula]
MHWHITDLSEHTMAPPQISCQLIFSILSLKSILLHRARFVDDLTKMTDAWFVLELTASGTKLNETF